MYTTTAAALQSNAGPEEKPLNDSASKLAVPLTRAVAPTGDKSRAQERLPANEHVRRIPSRVSRAPVSRPALTQEIVLALQG